MIVAFIASAYLLTFLIVAGAFCAIHVSPFRCVFKLIDPSVERTLSANGIFHPLTGALLSEPFTAPINLF